MKTHRMLLAVAPLAVLPAALALAPAPAAAAQDVFRWQGSVPAGKTIEVRGVYGEIRAEPAAGRSVEVVAAKTARRSDPDEVEIRVVEHDGGVTLCAVYPSRRRPNECVPGGGRNNVQDNDVKVNFTVRVPAGVHFVGATVNGNVQARGLNGDVDVSTVNGSIDLSTTGYGTAKTVNGSIDAAIGRADWSGALEFKTVNGGITLDLPAAIEADVRVETVNGDIRTDFPMMVRGRIDRRRLDGTIGAGGRRLVLTTINGGVRLRRAS